MLMHEMQPPNTGITHAFNCQCMECHSRFVCRGCGHYIGIAAGHCCPGKDSELGQRVNIQSFSDQSSLQLRTI